ncbi:hypothetical protein DVH24_002298 [Malus domestica]|uniref:Uncharacterized protein n=1 Tax=Malus domestica TaxID=3750 RepID=A0A498I6B5_MALDO|nr:hypothetical protein DVH24_002298 [Malus domestica]
MLGEVHINLTSNMSHDQLSNTHIDLDTGQMTYTIYVAELTASPTSKLKSTRKISIKSLMAAKFLIKKSSQCINCIHSQRMPNMKDSTTHLKRIIDKHLIPYLLLPCDATMECLTLREQVT